MLKRSEVYAAIDSEREYQDNLAKECFNLQAPRSVPAEILTLEHFVSQARAAWTESGDVLAIEAILENHGTADAPEVISKKQ